MEYKGHIAINIEDASSINWGKYFLGIFYGQSSLALAYSSWDLVAKNSESTKLPNASSEVGIARASASFVLLLESAMLENILT